MNNYLTEELLGIFLNERFNEQFIHNRIVPKSNLKFRPDYRSDKYKLIVEFDGYRHYNNAKVIINDFIKDNCYNKLGYSVIRIPYFVQLDNRVINILFNNYNIDKNIFNIYPHGFIDKKCLLPVDFNIAGYELFINRDYDKFKFIWDDILFSLKQKEKELKDFRLVAPPDFIEKFKLYK